MKKTISVLTILDIGVFIGYLLGQDKKFDSTGETISASLSISLPVADKQENFEDFIYRFGSDSIFQISRIKWPLKASFFTDFSEPNLDTLLYQDNWKMDPIYMNEKYRIQVYDNFYRNLNNTGNRLIAFIGIRNGISIEYHFKLIDGKWFLIMYRDDST